MKQLSLILISLLCFSLFGNGQQTSYSHREKLQNQRNLQIEFKNADENLKPKLGFTDVKSTAADFGNPPEWATIDLFGGSGNDVVREIVSSSQGEIFIIGSFSGEMGFEGNSWTTVGLRDVFLAKFQADGSFGWLKQFSPLEGERMNAYGVRLDNDGNVYFTGYYTGEVLFGDFNLDNNQDMNLFLAKTDSNGEITMVTVHPTSNPSERGLKVDLDDNGNIYVLASADGVNASNYPSGLIKFDPAGTLISEYSHTASFCDMKIVSQNIYFTGNLLYPANFGDDFLEPPGNEEIFVAKSNLEMEFEWAIMAEDNNNSGSSATGLFISADEDVFVAGSSWIGINWGDPNAEVWGGFFVKFSADGEYLWMIGSDFPGHTEPVGIAGDDEYVYISYKARVEYSESVIRAFQQSDGTLTAEQYSENHFGVTAVNTSENTVIVGRKHDGLLSFSALEDVSLSVDWSVQFTGNSAFSYPIGAAVDQYGFRYQLGYTSNQIDYFGQQIGKGLFLAKQAASGQSVWVAEFGNVNDVGSLFGSHTVVDTISGSVYIACDFKKIFTIPGGPTLVPDPNRGSFFIIKYDFNGNFQWADQINCSSETHSLATDQLGNVLVIGEFTYSFTFGNTTLNSFGAWDDIFLAKYNSAGQPLWVIQAGGEEADFFGVVSTDAQNNIYFTGDFYSQNVTVAGYPITMEDGDGNTVVAKLDAQGTVQWVRVVAGSSMNEWAEFSSWPTGILTDKLGNSYIKGRCSDSVWFGDTMLVSTLNRPGMGNMYNKYVSKFDTEGNIIWVNMINEYRPSSDFSQFNIDKQGNVYCGLRGADTTVFVGDSGFEYYGTNDLLIFKYSNDGQLIWVRSVDTRAPLTSWISSVCVDQNQAVSVSGWFNDYMDFGNSSFEVMSKTGFYATMDQLTSVTVYDSNTNQLEFELFPNPAEKSIYIKTAENIGENIAFQLVDATGRSICTKTFISPVGGLNIDISNYPSGVYFVKISSEKSNGIKKLIIQ